MQTKAVMRSSLGPSGQKNEDMSTTKHELEKDSLSSDNESDISSADDTQTILYGVSPVTTHSVRREKSPSLGTPPPLTSTRGRRLRQTSLEWLDPWADLKRRITTLRSGDMIEGVDRQR